MSQQVVQSDELLRQRVRELMPRAHEDLARLVSIRSVADERQFPRSECQEAARVVRDAFADVGVEDIGLHTTADGSEAFVGHLPGPPGSPTVMLYSHYDVQPSLGDEHWATPVWELTRRPLVRTRIGGLQGEHRRAPHRAASPARAAAGGREGGRRGIGGAGHRGSGGFRARARGPAAR